MKRRRGSNEERDEECLARGSLRWEPCTFTRAGSGRHYALSDIEAVKGQAALASFNFFFRNCRPSVSTTCNASGRMPNSDDLLPPAVAPTP